MPKKIDKKDWQKLRNIKKKKDKPNIIKFFGKKIC